MKTKRLIGLMAFSGCWGFVIGFIAGHHSWQSEWRPYVACTDDGFVHVNGITFVNTKVTDTDHLGEALANALCRKNGI